jgi:DNA-directed RNA polymerase alpha subunit
VTPLDDSVALSGIDELKVRTRNVLRSGGLITVGEVRARTDLDLLRMRNIGRLMLAELRAVLAGEAPPERGDRANPRRCPTCGHQL